MTVDVTEFEPGPGYAGSLQTRHPALAGRFHFWRGASGRRYAFTRFPANRPPAYENAISLFVRLRGADMTVLGASTAPGAPVVPIETEEIHVHLVQGDAEALNTALQDLSALAVRRPVPQPVELRAA